MSVFGWVNLGLGLLLLVSILGGVFWGMMRGGKRATIRLVTVIIGLSIALLLTPAVSKAFINVKIPVLGKSLTSLIDGALNDNLGEEAVAATGGLSDLAIACAVVVINIVMFFILYFAFKCISWIVYAILAAKFAPKYKTKKIKGIKEPREKNKRYRWWGIGVGAVTGLVFFGFLMIPVNGAFHTLDQIATYKPSFANYEKIERLNGTEQGFAKDTLVIRHSATNLEEIDENGMAGTFVKVHEFIRDEINTPLQNGFYGKIMKYTGFQGMSGASLGYMMNVRGGGHKINLRNDIINIGKLAGDGIAVAVEFTREGDLIEDKIKNWTDREYTALQNIIKRIFKIGFIQAGFEYTEDLIPVMEKNGTLDGVAGDSIDNAAMYEALGIYAGYQRLEHDLVSLVELAKMLFARGNGYYYDFEKVANNFDNPDELEKNVNKLVTKLKKKDGNITNAEKFTGTFFNMNLIKALLTGQNLSNLYKGFLSDALDINENDAVIRADKATYNRIGKDTAKILISSLEATVEISKVANGKDPLADRIVAMNTDKIADVLHELTNKNGVGRLVRSFANEFVKDIDLGEDQIHEAIHEASGVVEDIQSAIDEFDREIQTLRDQIATLTNYSQVVGSVDTLEAELQNLKDMGAPDSLIGELERALEDLKAKGLSDPTDVIAELNAMIDQLQDTINEVKDLIKQIHDLIADLDEALLKIAQIKTDIGKTPNQAQLDWHGTLALVQDIFARMMDMKNNFDFALDFMV